MKENHTDVKGNKNPMFGKSQFEIWKEKYGEEIAIRKKEEMKNKNSKSNKGIKKNMKTKKCPHCGKEGKGPNMSRYHFDNCKSILPL